MKTFKLTISIALLSLIAWGCSNSLSSDSKDGPNVTFKTTQDSYVLGDTVRAVLQNNSSHSVICGSSFQVEQKKHGKWKPISFNPAVGFTLEATKLSTGEKTRYRFSLADSSQFFPPHSFSEGQYRITTDISVETQNNDHTVKTHPFHVSDHVIR
jgi:hypothetical protein